MIGKGEHYYAQLYYYSIITLPSAVYLPIISAQLFVVLLRTLQALSDNKQHCFS